MALSASLTAATMQRNIILNGLADSTIASVTEHGSLVPLALREQIYDAEETISDVYFPLDTVLSIVARMKDGSEIEIGTIGREGTSAFPLLMGASSTANVCYCQVHGFAVKLPLRCSGYSRRPIRCSGNVSTATCRPT